MLEKFILLIARSRSTLYIGEKKILISDKAVLDNQTLAKINNIWPI